MSKDYTAMNNVDSRNQLVSDQYVKINMTVENASRILFVGNSITRHMPKPEIGWYDDCGMAASKEENDYVHRVLKGLEEKYGEVNYAIAQASVWERDYPNGRHVLETYYQSAQNFQADWVVIRLGENIPNELLEAVDCKPYFEEMIRFFASNPKAKVIVTDSFWPRESLDKVLAEMSEEHGYCFCQLHDLSQDESTMAIGLFEHQGVALHPGDYGMSCIAERILAYL